MGHAVVTWDKDKYIPTLIVIHHDCLNTAFVHAGIEECS